MPKLSHYRRKRYYFCFPISSNFNERVHIYYTFNYIPKQSNEPIVNKARINRSWNIQSVNCKIRIGLTDENRVILYYRSCEMSTIRSNCWQLLSQETRSMFWNGQIWLSGTTQLHFSFNFIKCAFYLYCKYKTLL